MEHTTLTDVSFLDDSILSAIREGKEEAAYLDQDELDHAERIGKKERKK